MWKKLSELNIDDKISCPVIDPIDGYDIDIDKDYDIEYLTAGWMIGDGWYTEKSCGCVFSIYDEYAKDIVVKQLQEWYYSVKPNGRGINASKIGKNKCQN